MSRRTATPLGENSQTKSIARNCLLSLISYGSQSASVFSIINKHSAEFSPFFKYIFIYVRGPHGVFSPPRVGKKGWMKFDVNS